MKPILRNILAVIIGWITGSIVNISLVNLGHKIFPIEGIDLSDMNQLTEIMPTLDSKHFLFPFLAHALGTIVGAAIAWSVASNHKMKFALTIGVLFLLGGIMVNYMLPGPTWFAITDIFLAYIPMGYLGGKLAERISAKK